MADLNIYEDKPTEAWYLHDPISGTEVLLTTSADRDLVAKAVEQGAVIIHQTEDGQREIGSIDQLPEPEEPLTYTFVAPEYVDSRVALIQAAIDLMVSALQGFLSEGRLQSLKRSMERAREAVENGTPEDIEAVASDLGMPEGPSIE